MNQQGAIKLSMVIAISLGLGFGASVFLNYQQHQRAEQDRRLLQGEIGDLRYQLKQEELASSGEPTPTPEPSSSPTPTPAVQGAATAAKTAVVKEAGNVRKGPSSGSDKLISMLPKGTVVTLGTGKSNGYQQITVNNQTGYILVTCLQY